MSLVTPAVLPASRAAFDTDVARLAALPMVDRIQIDVVDGRFATPASWPYTAPEELAERVAAGEMLPHVGRITYEIDLMCLDAANAANAWVELGASRLTFHAESVIDLGRFLTVAHEHHGCGLLSCGLVSFGLALNIGSDLALIEPYLDQIEYVQFMGIARIGRQGQPFDARVLQKIRSFHERHPALEIQVDGGVSLATAGGLLAAGATRLVVGSAILRAPNPRTELERFNALVPDFPR